MQKYRFIIDSNNEIISIIEHTGSITADSTNDILITDLESAKTNFQVVGIDVQPILDYEASL